MAGRGRGRSRGILDAVLTTPGGLIAKAEESELIPDNDPAEKAIKSAAVAEENSINSPTPGEGDGGGHPTLSLNDIKSILEDSRTYSEQNDVKRVLVCARNFVRTESDVKVLASLIYNKCLEDAALAKRGSEICDGLTSIEVGNTKFRNCILSLVQTDYKERNELLEKNPARFGGFLAFLCEIFGIMRTATNEVFKPLINPLFDCLNLVLGPDSSGDGDDSDDKPIKGSSDFVINEDVCETFTVQLQCIGRLLDEHAEDQMKELMNRIRTGIIISKSSPRVRCCLLEVVETYARGWEMANNDTTKFYCDMVVEIMSGLVL
ncbi:unnamed protein product [Candidula unifasciata]|uniref:MIF4G domain-containing protein n=1 Tax=Candidula unifasciata TaxID=100452 RepID=A0A8S3Z1B9_9EUPU|nr:unnamed protein product [Candidula unifasciata]